MSTATDEKKIMTPAEYREKGEQVRKIITSYNLCLDATIEDYPIGRRDRGKCRLQVERAKGKGYRTVRTTTNKQGHWCQPKKSTFRPGVIAVVTGLGGDRDIRWLGVGMSSVYLSDASGTADTLIKAPFYCQPRREDHRYTMAITSGFPGATTIETKECVDKADPPELCDAYDAWIEQYVMLRAIVLEVWPRS